MEWNELVLLALGCVGFLVGFVITRDPWMGLPPAAVLILAAMGFVVGSIIGELKHRTREGAFLGLLLGPVGWLIVRLEPERDKGAEAPSG
ncbi:MAG: hypothetical protein AAF657_37020 [Acidobacteriota bacterium]